MRKINKVAVLGSGVMGSRIACHFANIGVEVLLLDIVPKEAVESKDKNARNKIVNDALQFALKSNPSPIYSKSYVSRISTGNMDDDMAKIANCDWIIEVVIERLDIKKQVFENVEKYRKLGTLITTNTSGIPIHLMLDGRSEDFQQHFCGTHFFNPPRYLKLLELIPSPKTSPEVMAFLEDYGQRFLGKTTVVCKDTPAFIANRIGVYSIMSLFHTVTEMGLTVEEVDKLTGPVIGRPKSATFRTCDVVGLDTLVHVANGVKDNCPNDEANTTFEIPSYINKMVENNWLGSKTKQGFYKKVKTDDGKSEIHALNLSTLEYAPSQKVKFATLEMTKTIDDLKERMKVLINGQDKAGEFYRKSFFGLFAYVSNRIPEITDAIYKIDDALCAGFGWSLGPFANWDAVGVEKAVEEMEKMGTSPNPWVKEMLAAGIKSFYKVEKGAKYYYDINSKSYQMVPGSDEVLSLETLREENTIWKNAGATIVDLGDGIINLEFHTKMNTIGAEVIEGINKAIDLAEEKYKGLVIYNDGDNFSAGANVGMIFMMAAEQEYDELNFAIKTFQDTMMRVRYSSIPVIVAPHNLALGGGCEMSMHADKVIAHAETYMGLVEFGVGVIPGGGGTKEFALRASDEYNDGIRLNVLRNRFLTVGQAKVGTSAQEAFELGYLRQGTDEWIVSRKHQLSYAKQAALNLAEKGYTKPLQRNDIKVLGNEGLGIVYVGANSMKSGNYISEHDQLISEKLGYVLCGGNLSQPTEVNEQYLLDMERKAFLELCQQRKTLERLQSIITTGKVLRN
ncbi:MAG: 3-hydroxyacyl-CoA dehydrogenase/enoyl-CoA hydratase family protein [Flavobacteriales bacterium]|nr:3-hydroxyacyl-CoA dehydrogenase/enoyl-CoA hydratase family protein [Flavobacteriales bacterium]MCW8913311.1 3-hydroxyacyl-CoA dehydrogenase/enoyl-CoA hydratase family protein [Flavobacteriales bacterium]MCW8938341.1 3-hydroxyacyl-CoA dehydrogenase/enoyl-CoA hydratase family protein [Flavobacteriales bacterium]MCW8940322.1 3-hydroxyacyl-CoA dehydrogenase/enoyl-CoA hydratase family protein [Flavobacteriales bacterium]MCW8969272.1 3-hydroxyacyl-CoA dehydrogenase/enoyl-CoA hydratase family prote